MHHLRPRHAIRITGPWALVIGMVCLGTGIYQFLTSSALAAGGIATEAVVIQVDRRHRRSSGHEVSLTLEFEDQQGRRQRQRTGYSREHVGTVIGERLQVLYDPADPSEFSIDSLASLWWSPVLFSLFGVLGCGAFLLAPARREG